MPLGTRELFLIIRARDEASRTLHRLGLNMRQLDDDARRAANRSMAIGQGLATVGVGIAAVGAAGIAFYAKAGMAAIEYQKKTALTLTQIDKHKTSIQELGEIGKRVAVATGAPFEEMQSTLFDIFSSMDVNVKQSELLLTGYAKAAIAGQVSLKDAGRATIAIMNAFNIPAERVNEVLDWQFQLVRKGVGTYGEFAKVIGRAIPSTNRAGQSFQTLSGVLIYLTRNGLSAAMASASAARAMDAMAHPKVVGRLEEMGIKVRKANGEFRPLNETLTELQDKLGKMTAPQRAKALQDLFLGAGGTIQARRFFDMVLKNKDEVQEFNGYIKDMGNAAGAANSAFGIMSKTQAQQIQTLKERWKVLRVEIGEAVLPAIMALTEWIGKVVKWFMSLDKGTRENIVKFTAIAAVVMTVVGVLVAVVGMFILVAGAAAAAGISLGVVIGVVALVVVVLAALVIGLIYAYKKWDWFHDFVHASARRLGQVAGWLKDRWDEFTKWWTNTALPALKVAWSVTWNAIKATADWIMTNVVPPIVAAFKWLWKMLQASWDGISAGWGWLWNWMSNTAKKIWGPIAEWIHERQLALEDWWARHKDNVMAIWNGLMDALKQSWDNFNKYIMPVIRFFIDYFQWLFRWVFPIVIGIVKAGWTIIATLFSVVMGTIGTAFKVFWAILTAVVKIAWNVIYNVIAIAWHLISGIFSTFLSLITGDWKGAWEDIKKMTSSIFGNLKSMFTTFGKETWGMFKKIGEDVWNGMIGGMKKMASGAIEAAKEVASGIVNGVKKFFGIKSPSTVFAGIGGNIIMGLIKGIANNGKQFPMILRKVFGMAANANPMDWLLKNFTKVGPALMSKIPNLLGGMGGFLGKLLGGSGGYGGVKPYVAAVGDLVARMFGISNVGGVGQRGNVSDHPKGLALDFMVGNNKGLGYQVAQFLTSNWDKFNIKYLIWDAMYAGSPGNWGRYTHPAGRTDPTAMHLDHVHASFDALRGYMKGAWNTGFKAHLAQIHPNEMVLPADIASAVRASLGGSGASSRRGSGVNVQVYTQEIDPRRHAEQLGFEIAQRVG